MKGEDILCGVIYAPMSDELFTCEKGMGAMMNGQPCRISSQNSLINAFLVTGFPYSVKDNPEHCIEHFSHFVGMGLPIRRLGSAALDLAYIASGRFDGFWEVALQPWDMAAGALLVREAGGIVIDYAGNELNVLHSSSIIAGNAEIAHAIHQEIRKVNQSFEKK